MSSQITDLRNLVSQKEKEWKEAVDRRLVQLEEDLASKCDLLEDREAKLLRLKEDFKYNVKLLNDRDQEILRLEAEAGAARQRAHAADLAASESAVALDEARAAICTLRNDKVALVEEMDRQTGLQATQTERVRRELELQLDRQRASAAERERCLELEAVRLREEMAAQRRAMLADTEAALSAHAAEGRTAAEEMSKSVLAADLRAQLLERELEACRAAREEAVRAVAEREKRAREAAAAAEADQLRLQSEVALRDAEVTRLREAVATAETARAGAEEAASRQTEHFERAISERQAAAQEMAALLAAERDASREKLAEACQTFEAAQFDFGQVEWRLQEEVKQKQLLLEAAHTELASLRERAEKAEQRAEQCRSGLESDTRALRQEVAAKREEAAVRRQELAAALERERQLEAAKAQLELDAGARLEAAIEAERERAEGLVSSLVAKTGELNARLEAAQESLAQKELFLQGLIHERDLALQALRDNGLPFQRRAELRVPPEHAERLRALESEKAALAAELEAVKRQRAEEKEKEEEKEQEEEEEEAAKWAKKTKEAREPASQPLPIDPNSRHVTDLASNASRLRQERIQLVAQCRKQASRLQHLEAQLESAQREARERQTQVDKLEYEVSASARHHATELQAARRRATDLEGQLAESRREADEYYKGNLEQARLNEALERELALTKGRKEPGTPSLNFGAQELLIQQLQDEVEELRARLRGVLSEEGQLGGKGRGGDEEAARLRAKLKLAAQKLLRLAEENAVLRERSSHLRAALVKAGVPVPAAVTNRSRYPRAPPGAGSGPSAAPSGDIAPAPATGRNGSTRTRLQEVQGLEYAIQRQKMSARSRSHSPPERLPPAAHLQAEEEMPEDSPRPAPRSSRSVRPLQPSMEREVDSADGSLTDLWRQLGEVELGVSTSFSERGLNIRGRAIGEKTPRPFSGRRT